MGVVHEGPFKSGKHRRAEACRHATGEVPGRLQRQLIIIFKMVGLVLVKNRSPIVARRKYLAFLRPVHFTFLIN